MKIGAIDFAYIKDIDKPKSRPAELVWGAGLSGPIPFEDTAEPEKITIMGTLVKNATFTKVLDQQIEDLLALAYLNAAYNSVNITDLKGFLSVSGVKPKVSASKVGLREVSLDTWLYPGAQYQRYIATNPLIIANDFSLTFGAGGCDNYIPLPIGATYSGGDSSIITRVGKDGTITLVKANTSKNIKFDLVADEVNVGECKVWDTVVAGDTNESNWIRVFNTDHKFTGDMVVENGLVRWKLTTELLIYSWASAWQYESRAYTQNAGGHTAIKLNKINSINSNIVSINVNWTIDGSIFTDEITIYMGSQSIYFKATGISYRGVITNGRRFAFVEGDTLYDGMFLTTGGYQGTNTDNYSILIDPSITRILISCTNKNDNRIWNSGSGGAPGNTIFNQYSLLTNVLRHAVAYIYFSNIANLLKECEAMTQGSGVAFYTGADASPTTGNTGSTLDAQTEEVDYTQAASALGHGATGNSTYKLFVRAKDSAQIANDLRIKVENTTDVTVLANVTKTLTAAWAYYSVDVTLGSTDATTDNIKVTLSKDTATANTINLDYVMWIPITLDNGFQSLF